MPRVQGRRVRENLDGRGVDLGLTRSDAEGISVQPVKDVIEDKTAHLPENLKAAANHAVDSS
jgi:hypothetical protein